MTDSSKPSGANDGAGMVLPQEITAESAGVAIADKSQPSTELLREIAQWRKTECPKCGQRSILYCPFCCLTLGAPADVSVPSVALPFRCCDVVFDDSAKKATSMHAKVLAPSQVRLIDLFSNDSNSNRTLTRCGEVPDGGVDLAATVREIPKYDPKATVLLFPDEDSCIYDADSSATNELRPLEELTIVIIDAPWRRAQALRKHPSLAGLKSVRIRTPPESRFWRYHSEGAGCISTIEALTAFVQEVESDTAATSVDCGSNEHPLLFFFMRQLALISSRSGPGAELPTDAVAKKRRSDRVSQKAKTRRLCPLGAEGAALGSDGTC